MARAKPEADQPRSTVIGARKSPKLFRSPMASAAQTTPQKMMVPMGRVSVLLMAATSPRPMRRRNLLFRRPFYARPSQPGRI
jgi:hypothetical protein